MKRPGVGVGVICVKDGKLLLGRRIGSHGEGTWCCPGGHLEFKESWQDCAVREVKEETDLDVSGLEFVTATNDIFPEGKHYITIFMQAKSIEGDVRLMEPEKCTEWGWFGPDELPEPLFISTENLFRTGFTLDKRL